MSSAVVSGAVVASGSDAAAAESTATSGAVGPPTGVVNVSDNYTKIEGAATNDSAGWSTSSAGDVNGDGVTDLLVGAPQGGENDTGAAYLFYGPVDESNVSVADADVTFLGDSPGDRAGWSVAAGDVDAGGRSDIVIGAPYDDEGGTNAGAAYVVYGGNLSGTVTLGDVGDKLVGTENGSYAGFDVAARDVDSSDEPGVLVGAPSNLDERQSGKAYLLTANSIGDTTSLSSSDATFVGRTDTGRAGWSVSWAGDVDDDGVAEAAVGAPQYNRSGSPGAGAVYVVGSDAEGERNLSEAEATVVGASANDAAGFATGGAGDANGDGVADLVVGAPANDTTGQNAGAAYVIYGGESLNGTVTTASADVTVYGERPADRLGWSADVAGDVDCDGYADVVVGAPNHARTGAAYVVYGRSSGGSFDAAKLMGQAAGDFAGGSVAGIPAAGEGPADVLIGAPGSDVAGNDSGAAYLVQGQCAADSANSTASISPDGGRSGAVDSGGTFESDAESGASNGGGADSAGNSNAGRSDGESADANARSGDD
ncbi:integrin alpha, partial [Halorussus sp. GCM10023401]|uniref:integrin alpha n=3 Tax=Halorussus TaxID=1070314 RepID=UPI0036152B49